MAPMPRDRQAGPENEDALTEKEWDVIQSLVGTGIAECPWAWESDWPTDVDGEKVELIQRKFNSFVRTLRAGG